MIICLMEEVERVAKEKYQAIKEQMPEADDETIAILFGSKQFVHAAEIARLSFDDKEKRIR